MSLLFDSGTMENPGGFLQIVSELSGFLTACFSPDELDSDWTSSETGRHPCLFEGEERARAERIFGEGRPCIWVEDDIIFFGILPLRGLAVILGPAAVQTVSKAFAERYAQRNGIELSAVKRCDFGEMTGWMNLILNHFTGESLSPTGVAVHILEFGEMHSEGALEIYQLDQSENNRGHESGIDFENELLQAIRNGDSEAVRRLLSGPTPDYEEIGTFSEEKNKEYEYLSVSILALMTRAAVEGGARAEDAHALGDTFLNQLSTAILHRKPFLSISYHAMTAFAELVKRAREERSSSSYVEACKAYIEKNLRKDLKVGDIAPEIGLSRAYLSRLFHETEGMTVQQYIQREKCRHAARMLQYSDYPIALIAQYYGFSSQSYFGSCFRNWYGMTPAAYRKENH